MSVKLDFLRMLFAPAEESGADPNDVRTAHFLVEPSWLSGAGCIANMWGERNHYAFGLPKEEADRLALYSDWRMTGQDLRNAMVWIASCELSHGAEVHCPLDPAAMKHGTNGTSSTHGTNGMNGVHGTNGAHKPNGLVRK